MKCSLCVVIASVPEESRVPFAAHVVSDESILRYYASLFLDSLKRPADHATIVKEARRGTLMTERCARLIETHCACEGGKTETPASLKASLREGARCVPCCLASEIRERSDEMYAARDLELAADTLDVIIDQLIEQVCDEHKLFGDLLREEQCRRQTWDLALQLERK